MILFYSKCMINIFIAHVLGKRAFRMQTAHVLAPDCVYLFEPGRAFLRRTHGRPANSDQPTHPKTFWILGYQHNVLGYQHNVLIRSCLDCADAQGCPKSAGRTCSLLGNVVPRFICLLSSVYRLIPTQQTHNVDTTSIQR